MAYVVGLTGGIGSGKSAAADGFGQLGADVVDTDQISHALTQAGGDAIARIREAFGAAAIAADGAMDRRAMRERVFADPDARTRLQDILHPMIRERSQRSIASARGPYVVLVVPLLIESASYRDRVQRVLVVDCPEDLQVERVRARSGLAEEEVRRIIEAQIPRVQRLAAADDIIDNSGTFAALQQQVGALHQRYLDYASAGSVARRS